MLKFDLNSTTLIFYLLAVLAAWMPRPATVAHVPASGLSGRLSTVKALLALALIVHGWALYEALFGGEGLNIGFSHALSLIVWLTLLIYVLVGYTSQLVNLAALYIAPVAILCSLLTINLPGHRIVEYGMSLPFRLHFVVAILAYSLFAVAALHALLMLFLEKWLHRGTLPPVLQGLPPLLRIEQLLFQLLTAAFILLTLTLLTGVFFSEALFNKAFQFNHKTFFAMVSWLIFAGLLIGHWKFGWRGRTAIHWTLTGFILLLLSYIGSKFVLEIILKRI